MNRKDSLKHFYADQVEPERVRLMEDLRRTLESRSTELTAEYMEHFREFIKEVALAQEVRTKGKSPTSSTLYCERKYWVGR